MVRFLKSKFRKYNNAAFDKEKYIKEFILSKDGYAVVNIRLDSIDSAFSAFSVKGSEVLEQSLADYIDKEIYNIPLENPIVLNFEVPCAESCQKEKLKQVISNHYGLMLEDKNQDLMINLMTIFGLLFVGVLLLAFSYLLSSNNIGQLFTDIINIAGTFSLWEMVDLYLLDRNQKRIDKLNAAQTYAAEIAFSNCDNA